MFGKKKSEDEGKSLANSASYENSNDIQDASQAKSGIAAGLKTPKIIKPSIISEGFEFTGDINKFDGPLNVDGAINGNITVDSLTIGVNGLVSGVIAARSIIVKGKLLGKISCTDIVVGARSIVEGELSYSSITIQRGGVVKGDLHIVKASPARQVSSPDAIPASQSLPANPATPDADVPEREDVLPEAESLQDGVSSNAPDK